MDRKEFACLVYANRVRSGSDTAGSYNPVVEANNALEWYDKTFAKKKDNEDT